VIHWAATIPEGREGRRFHSLAKRVQGISLKSGVVTLDASFCPALHLRIWGFFEKLQKEQVRFCQHVNDHPIVKPVAKDRSPNDTWIAVIVAATVLWLIWEERPREQKGRLAESVKVIRVRRAEAVPQ
jgi:hypothetical protein